MDGSGQAVRLFLKQHADGAFPGAQLVVRHRGELVLDQAIGIARGFRADELTKPQHTTTQTLFPAYSCGKPIAALAIAILEDRGLIDPKAPLATFLPEFRNTHSNKATLVDVLTHRAGLHLPNVLQHLSIWADHRAMVELIADAPPKYRVGTLAYAPWEFGWTLSEIVRRITGVAFDGFVTRELLQPIGLRNLRFGFCGAEPQSIARTYWLGGSRVMVAGLNVADRFEEVHNDPRYLEAKNPACCLISNAGDLALLYDFLLREGVTPDGVRLISSSILTRYTTKNIFRFDRSLNTFLSLGRGFVLGTLAPSMFGWWGTAGCFGHAGAFCSLAGADRHSQISFAVLTNGNRGLADFSRRFIPLIHTIRKAPRDR